MFHVEQVLVFKTIHIGNFYGFFRAYYKVIVIQILIELSRICCGVSKQFLLYTLLIFDHF